MIRAGVFLVLGGCGYLGSARPADPRPAEAGWIQVRGLDGVRQRDRTDCGPAALASVLGYYGETNPPEAPPSRSGVTAGALRDLARARGYRAHVLRGTPADLEEQLAKGRPVIVGLLKPYSNGQWPHYEVVAGIHPELGDVLSHDPARGWTRNSREGFLAEWDPAGRPLLVIAPPGR